MGVEGLGLVLVFGLGEEGAMEGYSKHGSDWSGVLLGRSPGSP